MFGKKKKPLKIRCLQFWNSFPLSTGTKLLYEFYIKVLYDFYLLEGGIQNKKFDIWTKLCQEQMLYKLLYFYKAWKHLRRCSIIRACSYASLLARIGTNFMKEHKNFTAVISINSRWRFTRKNPFYAYELVSLKNNINWNYIRLQRNEDLKGNLIRGDYKMPTDLY